MFGNTREYPWRRSSWEPNVSVSPFVCSTIAALCGAKFQPLRPRSKPGSEARPAAPPDCGHALDCSDVLRSD